MMLEYSTEVRQAASVFTEYRNTIDIYTEDCEKDKEFYVKLLKRLLDDTTIQINDIYPLGCKRKVIKCCREDTDTRRKKLYIVDGDIFIQYKEEETLRNLHILDAYCIENFTICENSLCNVAYIFYGKDSYENIKFYLDIPHTLQSISSPLINLFFYYSIQMEISNHFRLMNIDSYIDNTTKEIDETKINNRIEEIRKGLIDSGTSEQKIDELYAKRVAKYPFNVDSLLTIVSGKDFLIPYFKNHIEKKLNCRIQIPKEAWKFNLIDKCDLHKLNNLKQAIIQSAT